MTDLIHRGMLFALLFGAATAGTAFAQESVPDRRGPVLLTLPASTRALGMGNAFATGSVDSDAIFYNPAFASGLRGAGIAVQRFGSASTLYTMSAGVEWWNGGLAVGLRALDHGLPMPGGVRTGEGSLHEDGEPASERAASIAYARALFGVNLGATAHVVEQRVAAETNRFAAGSLAAGKALGVINAGLAVNNIGPSYDLDGTDVDLPLMITLSATSTGSRPVGPLDLHPAVYVTYEMDGDVVPGAGLELSYWPLPGRTFSARVGARRAPDGVQPFTVGAGFTGDRLILDYALVPYESGAVAHRFGVRWR